MSAVPTIRMDPANFKMNRHSPIATRDVIHEEHSQLDEEELKLKQQEEELEIVKELKSLEKWYQVDPYTYKTPSAKAHSFTGTSLRGPHKILRRPLKFFNSSKTECVLVLYLGDRLCGNNGMVHNGILATLLDGHLASVTLPSLPNYTGFTANLNIDYYEPVLPNQWIVIRGFLDKVEGRKAYAKAWIESIQSVRMAEATALYISPKHS